MRLRLHSFITAALLSTSLSTFSSEGGLSQELATFGLQQNDCQFAGTFEQVKQLNGLDQGLTSNGVFYHHCEQGVIWSTLTPMLETLVMRRDGKGFVITDADPKQLKSRQGKFLSSLLNSLMSGDQNAIEKQFELTTLASGAITLKPKKRTLKRAIKVIEVNKSQDNKNVDITIVDRNFQRTHIKSVQTQLFDGEITTNTIAENCSAAMAEGSLAQADGSLTAEGSPTAEGSFKAEGSAAKISGCEQLLYANKDSHPKQKS